MLQLTETEKAYIAGIVDGEGCISIAERTNIRGQNYTYIVCITIANTYKELLEWIQAKLKAGRLGTKPRQLKIHKVCYELIFRSNEIESVLKAIVPYMLVKETQAKLMLEFLEISWVRAGENKMKPDHVALEQQLIYEELKALNKRGSNTQ